MEETTNKRLECLKLAVDLKYGSIEMTLSAAEKMYYWLTALPDTESETKQINS